MGMGLSFSVLNEDQLCLFHRCRDNVAHEDSGDIKFVFDRHGIKWKCVNRRQIRGEPGKGWACAELQCQKEPKGILSHGFRWDTDCNEVVTTTDAAEVPDAPTRGAMYEPVERLGKPPPPGCSMAPLILQEPPWPQSRRKRTNAKDFL